MPPDAKLSSGAEPKAKIFISYSRKDIGFAERLAAALRERALEPLMDRSDIYAFEDWWQRIEALIGSADTVVFVLSPDAVKSEVALKEVTYAASLNKRFAPIVYRPVEDVAVPDPLRPLNFIFFDDPGQFEASTDRLAEALHTDIGWVRQHTEYGEAERRWSTAGRPRGLLLHSPALEVAEYWIGSRPFGAPEPTQGIRDFVAASQKAEVAARRRTRILNTSLYTMLIGIILGLLGWINQATVADDWRFLTVTWPYERANVRPYVLSAAKEHALRPRDSFKECANDCPEMIVIPAGSFTMGSPAMEKGRRTSESPQHTVKIAEPFAVSKYELTFDDWDACVRGGGCNGYDPKDQSWGRSRQPIINVNWNDAQEYVAWLSQVTSKPYRLLSESEYEYATRAGTTMAYPWGDDIKSNGAAMAHCNGCGSQWNTSRTAPVGSFPPNKFGLYDMVGNVFEWTEDCFHENYIGAPVDGSPWLDDHGGNCIYRRIRGGSWVGPPAELRSAYRLRADNFERLLIVGFSESRVHSLYLNSGFFGFMFAAQKSAALGH